MNLADLQKKLIAAARANPPGDGVPYAFEKRILARLAGKVAFNPWLVWERGLLRAAAFCVLLTLCMGSVSWFTRTHTADSLSVDVEQTLFAAVDGTATDSTADTQ